jgi:hypothetical protein
MATNTKENGDPKRTKLPIGHKTQAKELHNIRYIFTETEIAEKAKRLANAVSEKARLEDELKTMKSEHKAKIDAQDAVINQMSQHVGNGFEMKNVECQVFKDFEKGNKVYYYEGREYDTAPLTQSDRQTELNLINRSTAGEQDESAADAPEAVAEPVAEEEQEEEEEEAEKE